MQVEIRVSAKSTFGTQTVYQAEADYDGNELNRLIIAFQKAINHISAKKAKRNEQTIRKGL